MQAQRRRGLGALIGGGVLGVVAVGLLGIGVWGLAVDRFGRDSDGYLSISTTQLRTDTHALVGELQGDGPGWLYGSAILGDTRARATSLSGQPLFVGIARSADVSQYLAGAGYATIEHLATGEVTAHSGGAPSQAPAQLSIWAASKQGAGQQTLAWDSRSGDWRIVIMNADASAGVAVRGDAGAKAPLLLLVALLCIVVGGLGGVAAALLVRRGIRAGRGATPVGARTSHAPRAPTPTHIITGVGR